MTSYQLTPSAERDVENIWDFLSHDSAESADHVIASLRSAFELIGRNPGIGHKRQDFMNLFCFGPLENIWPFTEKPIAK